MRLKFLFFPIVLVISLSIFSGFIWPEIGNVKRINEERLTKNAELKAIAEKQVVIEENGKKIADNAEGGNIVNNYLPENKTEERIISGINYLASDANVSLVSISLSGNNDAATPANISAYDTAAIAAFAGIEKSAAPLIDPITGQPVSSGASSAQATEAKISVVGDYDKVRIFLDSVQRMPILNTIKSLNITRQADETNGSALAVNATIDFGYMPVAKINRQQLENFDANLDSDAIDSLRKYISQKSQSIEDGNNAKGKTNPFMAN